MTVDLKKEQRMIDILGKETYEILNDLDEKGFREYILIYTRIYDKIFDGLDEDGYPDFSYEYHDNDFNYTEFKWIKGIQFDFKVEEDSGVEHSRILLGIDEDSESGEYPSGGCDADHITYSNYNCEYRNRYYLRDTWNESLSISLVNYIQKMYPNSKIAQFISQTNIANDEMIDDLNEVEF